MGVGIVKSVVETKRKAVNYARQLLNRARQEIADENTRRQIVELIETILLYKLPKMTRQELEAMFGLDELKKTRYFQDVAQEAKQEGKLEGKQEAVPKLLQFGLTIEQVAEALDLSVEQVRQAVAKSSS